MLDYHVHPDFSSDAAGSVEQFCQQAVKLGLREICFTTHYEPDPVRAEIERVIVNGKPVAVDSDWPSYYLMEIERCRRQFPELNILAGVEVGYEPGLEKIIADFLDRYQFDFVLGAVHCLEHVAITARNELDQLRLQLKARGAAYFARRYAESVNAAARCRLFDCIAHLDIWRKYLTAEAGRDFAIAIEPFIEPMLKAVAQNGTGLEINTSALRRGDCEPYPAEAIVSRAQALGVRLFTIGSDAHRVEDLGSGIERALNLLQRQGLRPVRFRQRRPLSG